MAKQSTGMLFGESYIYRLARPPVGNAILTPIEEHGGLLVKRDDTFEVAGVHGGKARTCWYLAQGAKGLVTVGWFGSPQVQIVGHVAKALGVPCRAYVPGNKTMQGYHIPDDPSLPEMEAAGVELVRAASWFEGMPNVLAANAKRDAIALGWTEIPFGMECDEAVNQTRQQVANIPACKRIVAPVGSGMSLAGILWGLRDYNKAIPVLGVIVGAKPDARLDNYAPHDWKATTNLVSTGGVSSTGRAPADYGKPAKDNMLGDLHVDDHYEAKCLPFLQPGNLLWVVGLRNSVGQY